MNFKTYLETYSRSVMFLNKYFKNKPLDLASYVHEFIHWKPSEDILRRLNIPYNKFKSDLEDGDYDYDLLEKIEKSMTRDEIDDFISGLEDYGYGAPPWKHMDYETLIPRGTWLIHFSKHANDITYKGFKYGETEISRLSYTKGSHVKYAEPGFNFAFIATSKDAVKAANTEKYGDSAVMFQSAGVKAYHYGDEESQVVFWGEDVAPGSMVYLSQDKNTDQWCVNGHLATVRDYLYCGSFSDAVSWVIKNHHQYRKQLFAPPPKGWYKR